MSQVPTGPSPQDFIPGGFKLPERRRRRFSQASVQPFGGEAIPSGNHGNKTIANLVAAVGRFGPIVPTELFPKFTQAGPDPRDRRFRRPEQPQQQQPQGQGGTQPQSGPAPTPAGPGEVLTQARPVFQGDVAPILGGDRTAISIRTLESASHLALKNPEPATNPLRSTVQQV